MSWRTANGQQVDTPRNDGRCPQVKERAKAVAMVALCDQGWSYREIAKFFGYKHASAVQWRVSRVPRETMGMRGAAKLVG